MDKNLIILKNKTIKEAMELINLNKHKCIVIVDKKRKFLGTLSDGDIRNALLNNFELSSKIAKIYNSKAKFVFEKDSNIQNLKKIFLSKNYDIIPIINSKRQIIDVVYWAKIFNEEKQKKDKVDVPVIIMAGGLGTRMQPFTHILPKPLIPINNKPTIEHIMQKFILQGISRFTITINHKAHIMKSFFREIKNNYKLNYIEEKKPLGTAGALKLLEKKISKDFFVINCDTIINTDFKEIYNFHRKSKNSITIIASAKEFTIPYGICKTGKFGKLKSLVEKPKINFLANSGGYVVKPNILKIIPRNKKFDFTQLILAAKKNKFKIGVFPINDNNWLDVGQWSEYKKTVDLMKNEN
tara:strand:- start:1003 stop:2064 length:1062 start_codon:yes stop_codon:yes gene_type:complete